MAGNHQNMTSNYQHQDFYLAAYLISCGLELTSYYRKNGLTTFEFEHSDRLDQLVDSFYKLTATVNPVTYGISLRNLKSIIHSGAAQNGFVSKPKQQYVSQFSNAMR